MRWADGYTALRSAIDAGEVDADLGRWLLEQAIASASHAERGIVRDRLLCEAAALCPGSTWARAGAVAEELAALDRGQPPIGAVRQLLVEALALDPRCPRSQRQLYNLTSTENEAADFSVASVAGSSET